MNTTNFFKKYKKELIALSMYILFFIISDFLVALIYVLGIDLTNTTSLTKQIISLGINLVFPILLIIVYRKDLFNDLKKIKKNYKSYLEIVITYYAIGLIGMVVSNYILQFILKLGIATNESSVRNLINTIPIYMFVSACIIAPFQEEMIFRKTFKDIFKNKIFYIVFSGFIFGAIHVVGSLSSYTDLLFIIPYGFLGSIFALIYTKTDNICMPIIIHLLHNTILVMLQIGMGV